MNVYIETEIRRRVLQKKTVQVLAIISTYKGVRIMKKTRETIRVIGLMAIFTALMFTLSFAQEPIKPIKPADTEKLQKPIPIPRAERVTSCMAKLTIETQISTDWLRRSIHVDARATNMNNVEVTIYHSFVQGNNVKCQYKSRNGDIPNLVYEYPCRNARRDPSGGYEHRYLCAE